MKTIEEEYILLLIEKYEKKKIEYLEVDRNNIANKYQDKIEILENIYRLMQDGYEYRIQNKKKGDENK